VAPSPLEPTLNANTPGPTEYPRGQVTSSRDSRDGDRAEAQGVWRRTPCQIAQVSDGQRRGIAKFRRGTGVLPGVLGTQAFADLEHARESFGRAERSDPNFALAAFYAAVSDNELRRHDSAIDKLNSLAKRDVSILPETYLQLAYAYTKKYTEEGWSRAEEALNRAETEAKSRSSVNLLPTIESYRVFLYSVIGGRSKRPDSGRYLRDAIDRGHRVLRRARTGLLLRRAHIAWLLRGSRAVTVQAVQADMMSVPHGE